MACVSLKKCIAPDSQLSTIHFLLKSKADRGDSYAVAYNAERFFDHFEGKTLADLKGERRAALEEAMSQGLIRLGFLIAVGGVAVLVKGFAGIVAVPVFLFLLWGGIRIIVRASARNRALRGVIAWLDETRGRRREEFVGKMLDSLPRIAACRQC